MVSLASISTPLRTFARKPPVIAVALLLGFAGCVSGGIRLDEFATYHEWFMNGDDRCGSGTTHLPRGYQVEYPVSKEIRVIVFNTTTNTMPVLGIHRRYKSEDTVVVVWTQPGRERRFAGGLGGQHYDQA